MSDSKNLHALIEACSAGHLDPSLYFVFHLHVSPFLQDARGETALIAACKSGHTSIVCALVLHELFRPTHTPEPSATADVTDQATHAHARTHQSHAPHPMALSLDAHALADALETPTVTAPAALRVEEGIR